MWKSGRAVRKVSWVCVALIHVAKASAFESRFVCVSMAPFAVPVVPPVYWSAARSWFGSMFIFRSFFGLFLMIWPKIMGFGVFGVGVCWFSPVVIVFFIWVFSFTFSMSWCNESIVTMVWAPESAS